MLNRRSFLATGSVLLAGAMCRAPAAETQPIAAASRRRGARLERIGIQLYAVRGEMRRDFEGTLRRLADIGYREVEFAGYYDRSPAELRAILDRHGITAPSTHIGYDALTAAGWERVLDDAAARGHAFVTVPWLPVGVRGTVESWRAVARRFNQIARAARDRGLRFAYHNHEFEFTPVGGIVPFDLLLRETDPALVSFQMDLYWVVKGGGDPLAYMRAHPGRFSMLHVKDSSGPPAHAQVDVGRGTIDFAAILRLATDQQALRHVFVEHDQPDDAMAFARSSFDYLKSLEF